MKMHSGSVAAWQHDHVFLGAKHDRHERRTWFVVALTAVMMVAEIVGGTIFGSMALVADGWHMSTHAAALSISAFASALILALVALLIGYESLARLLAPVPIRFTEATVVAFIGLAVNIVS